MKIFKLLKPFKIFNVRKIDGRGFSLVETIIYVALLVLIVGITIVSIVSMVQSQRNIKSNLLIQESAMVALDRMVREIRDSSGVDVSSTFGSNPGILKLNGTDISNNSRTVEFYVNSGRLMLKENGVVSGPLTLASVTVSNLVFRFLDTASSDAVKIEMTLVAGTGETQKTENFYTTTILRSSY